MRLTLARISGVAAIVAATLLLPAVVRGQSDSSTVCSDGTRSNGDCGQHGGVDAAATTALRAGRAAAQRPPSTAATMVTCADGFSTTLARGACDMHGGVKSTKGQQGPVQAALQMENHAQQWEKTIPAPRQATGKSAPNASANGSAASDSAAQRKAKQRPAAASATP